MYKKTGVILCDPGSDSGFLDMTSKAQTKRKKQIYQTSSKLKPYTIKKVERKPTECGKKICKSCI